MTGRGRRQRHRRRRRAPARQPRAARPVAEGALAGAREPPWEERATGSGRCSTPSRGREPSPSAIPACRSSMSSRGNCLHPTGVSTGNKNVAGGYTYLGQFIDHDITFDPTSKLGSPNDPATLRNFRTPRFDLDSLYGAGPLDQPFLYDWDARSVGGVKRLRGVKLLVGKQHGGRRHGRRPAAQPSEPCARRRPAQRREHHRLAAAAAVHPLPQQGRRSRARSRRHAQARRGLRRGADDSCAGTTSGS